MNDYAFSASFPKPVGVLVINENFSIMLYKKMPNKFHRWMARILLGWKYEERE